MHDLILILQLHDVGTIIILILKMTKLKHREVV